MASFRDIDFALADVSDVSAVLPLTVWLFFAKKQGPYLIHGVFFCLFFAVNLYTLVTAELGQNNLPAYHLLALLQVEAVYIFFCQLAYQRIYWSGVIGLIIFHMANAIFYESIWTFNSLAWTIDMIIMIIVGLSYFLKLYNNEANYTPLQGRPDFTITAGWLLYASGSLFTYLMGTKILSGYAEGFFKNAWLLQSVSNILKDIIISYGFWLTTKI